MNRLKKHGPEAAAFVAIAVLSFAFRAPLTKIYHLVARYGIAVIGGLPFGQSRAVPPVQADDGLTVANLGWAVGIENLVFDLGYEGKPPAETAFCEVFDSAGKVVLTQPLGAISVGATLRVQVNFQDDDQREHAARLRVCSADHRTPSPAPPAPRPASKA